jgi:hypothetical protein
VAVFAAALLHSPAVETIQRASELILAELSSLVRAPQLPMDAIMCIVAAARAAAQRWIALTCFHCFIALPPSAQASTTVRRCDQLHSTGQVSPDQLASTVREPGSLTAI